MPTYNYECVSCDFVEKDKFFNTFNEFTQAKCPKCSGEIKQTFDFGSVNFKIKGYCYNNEYHGKSMYRDHVKKYEKSLKD